MRRSDLSVEDWEREYDRLMETARKNLEPEWEHGEVVVLKTAKGNLYVARIPDYQDADIREPLENRCIEQMQAAHDTEVFCCLATVNGEAPEILSWNFRSRLIEINPENLNTESFLWGGGEDILLRPFSWLLPPKK